MSIWERFDNIVKPEEVNSAKTKIEPPDEGVYEMELEEIQCTESKTSNLPMLAIKFRIIPTNKIFYFNQVLISTYSDNLTVKNIATAVRVIEGLIREELDFKNLSQIEEIVPTIPLGERYKIKVTYEPKYKEEKKFPIIDFIEDYPMTNEDTEF